MTGALHMDHDCFVITKPDGDKLIFDTTEAWNMARAGKLERGTFDVPSWYKGVYMIGDANIDTRKALADSVDIRMPVIIAEYDYQGKRYITLIDGLYQAYKAYHAGTYSVPAYILNPEQTAQIMTEFPPKEGFVTVIDPRHKMRNLLLHRMPGGGVGLQDAQGQGQNGNPGNV